MENRSLEIGNVYRLRDDRNRVAVAIITDMSGTGGDGILVGYTYVFGRNFGGMKIGDTAKCQKFSGEFKEAFIYAENLTKIHKMSSLLKKLKEKI